MDVVSSHSQLENSSIECHEDNFEECEIRDAERSLLERLPCELVWMIIEYVPEAVFSARMVGD